MRILFEDLVMRILLGGSCFEDLVMRILLGGSWYEDLVMRILLWKIVVQKI